jgi:tRNA-dihydrouridine synthase A
MVGCEVVANPYLFAAVDHRFVEPAAGVLSRAEILRAWRPYLAAQMAEGVPLRRMTRHALGLFQGCPGARQWRRALSEPGAVPPPGLELLDQALGALKDAA